MTDVFSIYRSKTHFVVCLFVFCLFVFLVFVFSFTTLMIFNTHIIRKKKRKKAIRGHLVAKMHCACYWKHTSFLPNMSFCITLCTVSCSCNGNYFSTIFCIHHSDILTTVKEVFSILYFQFHNKFCNYHQLHFIFVRNVFIG